MTAPRTAGDARMLIAAYEAEAARARGWAAVARRQANDQDARAAALDARAAECRGTLPGLPEDPTRSVLPPDDPRRDAGWQLGEDDGRGRA